jgi:hypothetical protein
MQLSALKINPANPRIIRDEKFKQLVESLLHFPKMMNLRPIITDDEGMILGGNMRLKALQELGYKEIPNDWVKKAAELTEEEKREFIIKDNVGFGEWEWTMLSDWEQDQLLEWGLDIPGFDGNADDYGENFTLPDGDRAPFQQMTFTLADQQAKMIKESLRRVKINGDTYGNENSNGNALHQIVFEWDAQRK